MAARETDIAVMVDRKGKPLETQRRIRTQFELLRVLQKSLNILAPLEWQPPHRVCLCEVCGCEGGVRLSVIVPEPREIVYEASGLPELSELSELSELPPPSVSRDPMCLSFWHSVCVGAVGAVRTV